MRHTDPRSGLRFLTLLALLGLLGRAASAQPVWQSGATAVGTGNTATVGRPSGVESDDLLVVGLMYEKGTAVTVLTPPAGWTFVGRTDAGSNNGMATFYRIAGDSEPASYAFTLNESPKWSIGISRLSNANPEVPILAFSSNASSNASTSVTSLSVGAVPANSLVLSYHSNKKSATFSAPSGTTERYDAPNSSGGLPSNMLATVLLPTAGTSDNRTATASESDVWVAQQLVVLSGETDTYTPGTSLFTVPSGVTELLIEAWGGGGGGAKGTGGSRSGRGGGGGAYARRVLSVMPGQTYDVTPGNFGAALPASLNNVDGNQGAASVFSTSSGASLLTANGGGPGGVNFSGVGAFATTGSGIVSFAGGDGADAAGGGAGGSSAGGGDAVNDTPGAGGILFGGNGGSASGGAGQSFGGGGGGEFGNGGPSGAGGAGAIRIHYLRTALSLSQPADAIVGTRVAYTVSRATESGFPVPTGSVTLDLGYEPTSSPAQFYANASGGSPITTVTIPDGSSSATFYFTTTVPNTYTVTVSSSLYDPVTDVVQFTPAPPAKFVITQTNGQPIGPQLRNIPFNVRVTLTDAFGNAVSNTGGTTTVTLTAAGGAIAGSLQSQSAPGSAVTASLTAGATSITFSNVYYTGASAPAGFDVVITATGTGSGDGNGKTGESNAFSVRNISLSVVAADAALTADGVSTTSVTATLSEVQGDGSLTPIAGQPVRVATDFGILIKDGSAVFQQTAFTTDANGQVSLSLRAGTVAGLATVTAQCPGSCPATATVSFVAGPPSAAASALSASKTILSGDANNANIQSVLTLRLRDAFGNPATTTSAIAFTSTLGTPIGSAENLGSGVYRATLTAEEPGTDRVGATIAGVPIDATVEIRILPIEQYRTNATGNWNDPSTWQRILPSGGWQNTNTFPQPVLSESLTLPPSVAGVSAGANPFPTTGHTIALPAGLTEGDRLLLFWADANTSSTVTPPSGWTPLYNTSGSGYRRIVFQKSATGSEPRTIVIETSAAERSAHAVLAVAAGTHDGETVVSPLAIGTSASPDAPLLTTGFGSVGTLYIAAAFAAGDDNTPAPSAPSGYAGLMTGYAGEGTGGARTLIASRQETAASNDPAAFTLGSSVTWSALTVAVRGNTVATSPTSTSALIRNTHTVTVTADQPMDQVIVEAGGTLGFQGESALTGLGPFVMQTGSALRITSINGITATSALGNIRFTGVQGGAARTYAADATYTYESAFSQSTGDGLPAIVRNLTVSNAAGVSLTSDLRINGRLSLSNGPLTVPSGRTLDLDGYTGAVPAAESGRIILESGAIYRNLTVQRPRIEARRLITGLKGWRMIASPLAARYADLFSGFVTQGFSGSSFPDLQTNLMWWDESDEGTTLQGWRKPASIADSITAGRGHFHYVFNGALRPDQSVAYADALPRLMTVTGFEHPYNADGGTRFQWPVTRSVRDTSSQTGADYVDRVTADAGWNLIGNPTASVLNWDEPGAWTKTGLSSTIYVWDPSGTDYRVWNGSTGNLEAGRIAPFQSFWVKAETADPVLTMTPAAKSVSPAAFRGKEQDSVRHDASVLAFRLDVDGREAQTWLQFSSDGRTGYDPQDAFRLSSPDNSWLTLHTRAPSVDAAPMLINHLPVGFEQPLTLDLEIGAVRELQPVSGTFTLSWARPAAWPDDLHVVLMDHESRTTTLLSDSGSVTFDYDTPRSFAAKTVAADPLNLPASPVLGSDGRAKMASSAYTRQTRFSLMVSNQPADDYLPRTVVLDPNYPNPFNPSTTLRFHLPEPQRVRMEIFDVMGRLVAVVADSEFGAGSHSLTWDAGRLASGVYLMRLTTPGATLTRTMTLLK